MDRPADPRLELSARLTAREDRVAELGRADARVARGRLLAFVAAAALAVAAWQGALAWAWLALPAAAFLALVVHHDGVLRALARARRAVAFHAAALSRLDGTFAGKGVSGERFSDPAHPYAADLDLFGPGALFELVCTARTRPGEEQVARWLLSPAEAGEVRSRQRAVAELLPRLDLREDLAILGEDVRAAVDPASLAAWGEARATLPRWATPAGALLGVLAVAALAAWLTGHGVVPLLAVIGVAWGFRRLVAPALDEVLGGLDRPAAELRVLGLLLARLAAEPLQDERLRALQARLAGPDGASSARIARLVRLAARLEWEQNQLFAPIGFLLQWRVLHGAAVERWRRRSGPAVRGWLAAAAELEALASLAGYAHEHPDHVQPEVIDLAAGTAPVLEGRAVRHPLLRDAVANEVSLGGAGPRALLVSGSNMSGKSTYLRTVGVNVVLALAGAPVRAASLRLTPLHPGATLRIQDSLQAGRSRFYAEITRLKELVDLAAGRVPLLFLLDEILHGTNSHDRRIGAEALVRTLLGRGAIGLVTTHDLALTELAGPGGADALANAHFEDQVRDGAIAFDYRLRPGVVAHSNALALMRAVGLEV